MEDKLINNPESIPSQDIAKIEETFTKKIEAPSFTNKDPKQTLKESIQANFPAEEPKPSPTGESSPEESLLPDYIEDTEDPAVKAKLEALVNQALDKGIASAVKSATKESPFILDAFHDALVDKIYPHITSKNKK